MSQSGWPQQTPAAAAMMRAPPVVDEAKARVAK
jgi:hypothetical protein